MYRHLLTIGFLFPLLVGCASIPPEQRLDSVHIPENAQVLVMRAPNMICPGCSGAVEGGVLEISGVLSVRAIARTKDVTVLYDPAVTTYETIFNHVLFDAYGREFVSNGSYSP